VQLAQADPSYAVATRLDPTHGVGSLPTPPLVGRGDECVEVISALIDPALVMPGTQTLPAGRTRTPLDPTRAATKDRIGGGKDEGVGPELGANRAEEQLQQR